MELVGIFRWWKERTCSARHRRQAGTSQRNEGFVQKIAQSNVDTLAGDFGMVLRAIRLSAVARSGEKSVLARFSAAKQQFCIPHRDRRATVGKVS